jgi:broad specificity phosphatase PhoE
VARVQLLLIRHALPLRTQPGEGADPDLSDVGYEQAQRLPDALSRHPITRVLSSPQRRAQQTAAPVAKALGLDVEIDDRLAEYDRDLAHYVPIEQIRTEFPEDWKRLAEGHLPGGVDEDAFVARVFAAITDAATTGDDGTVAIFSHGGVINVTLHRLLGTERLLLFPIDYASITRLRYSRTNRFFTVAEVNGTEHVWDLLPRNVS